MSEAALNYPLCKLPEYESAIAELGMTLVGSLMTARDPILGQVRQETVDHLPDGSVPGDVTVGYMRGTSTEFRFRIDMKALIEGDLEAWAVMIHDAAEEGLASLMPQFFAGLDEACQKAGTVVDAKGKPFGWDLFLDGIEAVELDFDENGKPKMPSLVVSPKTFERVRALPPLDAAQEARFKQIVDRKKAQFDARRRTRRLA